MWGRVLEPARMSCRSRRVAPSSSFVAARSSCASLGDCPRPGTWFAYVAIRDAVPEFPAASVAVAAIAFAPSRRAERSRSLHLWIRVD